MAEIKTTRNDASVEEFLDGVDNEKRRNDARVAIEMMKEVVGAEPAMWGTSIVGFEPYRYRPASGGAEHEWFTIGLSPRKQSLTLYIMDGFSEYDSLLGRLGPHSTGKSCLYIKDIDQVDKGVLRRLMKTSVEAVRARQTD